MHVRLNDEQCLLWIKDPSISPFVNNQRIGRRIRKYRKNILTDIDNDSDDVLKNPKSFINKVRRRCFYNSALRQKIIDQIKEYQHDGTLRLYTLNDKITETIEYISEPFTRKECMRWAKNHLVNPKTNNEINMDHSIYVELVYTTLQYGLSLPSIFDTEPKPTDIYQKSIHNIAKDVKTRLQFMKENDEYFLKHDVASFDKKLKIESARKATIKQKNTFSVSSSSNKSLNSAERRLLRDIELENMEEKELAAAYQFKKRVLPISKRDIKNNIFDVFIEFIGKLQNEVMNGDKLINKILEDVNEHFKMNIITAINIYLQRKKYNPSNIKNFLKDNKLDTIEGVISNFITNIYSHILVPSIKIPLYMEIGLFSARNKLVHFKDNKIIMQITKELENFLELYLNKEDYKIKIYFMNLVKDRIPREFIYTKLKYYIAYPPLIEHKNFYYTILINESEKPAYLPVMMRLPVGQGLLIGKELTKAIIDLGDPNFEVVDGDSVLIDDNPLNGFTYEECKKWVIIPIINPRTFKRILIDSPIYNRLLCISYQYDTKLIPRMITHRGYDILMAFQTIIVNILNEGGEVKQAQSREQLENYIISAEAKFVKEKEKNKIVPNQIGLQWKNAGAKHPNGGVEIINKKLMTAFLNSTGQNRELPFYVSFSEEDFAKFGITDITKNSYIEISTYYIQAIDNKNKTVNNRGLRWKIINNERDKEGIKRNGVEIINKKFKNAFLKLASKGNVLPARASFSEDDLWKFGMTTATGIANNRYIKFTYYYKPVYEKSFSDIIIKPKSNVVITKRDPGYVAYKYYTVADCLRWAHQPNRDPVREEILLTTDGKEYNAIFEQAILYDYNIMPINITSKGIRFMKSVIKTKGKLLTIANHLKHSTSASVVDITEINNRMCTAINNIFDDETKEEGTKYKKFKDKMKKKCLQYNKEPGGCMKELKDGIKNKFPPNNKHAKEYIMNYYEDSALASLLLNYDTKAKEQIYNEELRDIFIHNFNKFYVYIYSIDDELNELKKEAIDAGGPKREFFTKLFEELFCDDEHPTRPFISPTNIIGNLYCINPNFEPDENFRKVINAYNQNYNSNIEFNTERDYEYIYFVIGKLLCLPVYNELIGLPYQLSSYILAGLIKQQNEIDYYDILYFYLRDFENTILYINMINNTNIETLENSDLSFNGLYIISKSKGKSKDPNSVVNKDVEPPIPIKERLPLDLLKYKALSTTKDAVKNSSNERKLREYNEKWEKQLKEYVNKKEIYDRAGSKSSDGAKITRKNCIKFILQLSKHVVTKNFLIKEDVESGKSMKKRYDSLFGGFSNEIRKFLYKKKVTIEQLSLLITNEQLTIAILQELASKINVYMEVKYTSNSFVGDYTGERMSDDEQKERGDELKGYMSNIITQKRAGESDEEHLDFVKKLLRFWTGLTYYDKFTKPYQICYKYGVGINMKNYPHSHTCSYTLDFYGFPAEFNAEEKEKYIYDKFKFAVLNITMEMH